MLLRDPGPRVIGIKLFLRTAVQLARVCMMMRRSFVSTFLCVTTTTVMSITRNMLTDAHRHTFPYVYMYIIYIYMYVFMFLSLLMSM